ncbi:hypothetical protein SteCoe_15231 [Stentor coeruleus]|uniref:VPS9 domain-containing protein n=1 Tax=Stentor coeruleus TaxID=5963 RepID=A0A1R2C400_9CILI|nr:hypothetical protein SteCoe_15231 [Stentor coeruleus]
MGNKNSHSISKTEINSYFQKKEREQMKKFSKIEGYMENSGEWISCIRERLESLDCYWSTDLLKLVESWDARSDRGSKAGLVWLRYIDNSLLLYMKTKTRTSILGIETRYIPFERMVFSNMYKSLLYAQLTKDEQHILYKMNSYFVECLKKQYNHQIQIILTKRHSSTMKFLEHTLLDIDSYIVLLIEIMPKFYPQVTTNVPKSSIEPIIRNSMISLGFYSFIVKIFKAAFWEDIEKYQQSLEKCEKVTFTSLGVLETLSLNDGEGYFQAINEIKKIPDCKKLVDLIDLIGLMDYHISSCIDSYYIDKAFTLSADDLIPIFFKILILAKIDSLPAYLKILKFIGREDILPSSVSYLLELLESVLITMQNCDPNLYSGN